MAPEFKNPSGDADATPPARPPDRPEHYLRLPAAFLFRNQSLGFDLFYMRPDGEVEPLAATGEILTNVAIERVRRPEARNRLYVRSEDGESMLLHQESTLVEVLEDDSLPLPHRAAAVVHLIHTLTERVYAGPNHLNVYRLHLSARPLVDFVAGENRALETMLRLVRRGDGLARHALNCCIYGLVVARRHFPPSDGHDLHNIAGGLLLHDIGMTQLPQAILEHRGPVTETHWREIRKHAGYGETLLRRLLGAEEEPRIIAHQHHERLDGDGYPSALKDKDIHPYARACTIADSFDALTAGRPGRAAVAPYEALQIMKEEMGTQFDPRLFSTFVRAIGPMQGLG